MLAKGVTSSKVTRLDPPLPENFELRTQLQIERLQKQLVEVQKRGDLFEESRLCNNIAKKCEELMRWREAIRFHHYDRQISDAAGDIEGYLVAIGNMARVFKMYANAGISIFVA
jgi:hypothetical protein